MALKATAVIHNLSAQGAGTFALHVKFASHDTNYTGTGSVVVNFLDSTATRAGIVAVINTAIKAEMEANGAVAFGMTDGVRVLDTNIIVAVGVMM